MITDVFLSISNNLFAFHFLAFLFHLASHENPVKHFEYIQNSVSQITPPTFFYTMSERPYQSRSLEDIQAPTSCDNSATNVSADRSGSIQPSYDFVAGRFEIRAHMPSISEQRGLWIPELDNPRPQKRSARRGEGRQELVSQHTQSLPDDFDPTHQQDSHCWNAYWPVTISVPTRPQDPQGYSGLSQAVHSSVPPPYTIRPPGFKYGYKPIKSKSYPVVQQRNPSFLGPMTKLWRVRPITRERGPNRLRTHDTTNAVTAGNTNSDETPILTKHQLTSN